MTKRLTFCQRCDDDSDQCRGKEVIQEAENQLDGSSPGDPCHSGEKFTDRVLGRPDAILPGQRELKSNIWDVIGILTR